MTLLEFEREYLSGLNPQQRDAVLSVGGLVLLLATPGSGKTTVLVMRLGYMVLCRGIDPQSILTMTYTRAAARDMRERFEGFFGQELAARLVFRTINGVSARLVADVAARYGREPFSLLSDEGERARTFRELYLALCSEYPEDSTVRDICTAATYIKNMMLSDAEIEARKWPVSRMPELYRSYQAELRRRKVMDYDDQMVYALKLLRRFPDVLEDIQDRYRYICVDEAQDTSKVQHEIIRCLAGKYQNLFMVGDEDQSIYAFRAAFPDALMSFSADHPGAKQLLIEENYRSTPEIVNAANSFVAKNRFRHPKTMRTARPSGCPVRMFPVSDRRAQYDWLFSHAAEWGGETAVLFRNNDSLLPLADRFEKLAIAYRCRSFEDSFFSHRIVRDILDTIRFAAQPGDPELFLRLYYKYGAGISGAAARQAVQRAGDSGKDLFTVLLSCSELKPVSRDAVSRIIYALRKIRSDTAVQAVRRIWEDMHYGRYVDYRGMDSGKYFILRMLAEDLPSANALIEKLSSLSETISSHENQEGLTLSTIHSSKGLEYDRVVLLDMVDGVLPGIPAARVKTEEEIRDYEEERRLFYVAMTRARDELWILLPSEGASFPREVVKSLPLSALEKRKLFGFLHLPLPIARPHTASERQADPKEFISRIKPGSHVVHRRFGPGSVIGISGDILTVDFDRSGRKKLSVSVSLRSDLLKLEDPY